MAAALISALQAKETQLEQLRMRAMLREYKTTNIRVRRYRDEYVHNFERKILEKWNRNGKREDRYAKFAGRSVTSCTFLI
jgi:hypothetical protein